MDPSGKHILIIGAGMAGLACANRLHETGQAFVLVDGADAVGGRVRTDQVDGFLLDRGFQVFLSAYPEAGRLLDLPALDLRRFSPGALVFEQGKRRRLMDVFRSPKHAIGTALQPIGSIRDKLLVAKMRWSAKRRSAAEIFAQRDCSTEQRLREFGFSARMIDRFFRPFYGGIFLERELRTSARMFDFTFKMFAEGHATVPSGGMGAIPEQLAARLPQDSIRLNAPVRTIGDGGATLHSGEHIAAERIVVATDGSAACQLLGGESENPPQWRATTTMYFAADRSPLREAIIALDGTGDGLVNNVCTISDVAPEYAPVGRHLISVSLLGEHDGDNAALQRKVKAELRVWFGRQVDRWKHLRSYTIRKALPEQAPGSPSGELFYQQSNLFICGDHQSSASIEGAVCSGLRCADALLAER